MRTLVSPPPILSRRHGLIASSVVPTDDESRWDGGYEFAPLHAGSRNGVIHGVDAVDPAGGWVGSTAPDLVTGEPFVLEASFVAEAKMAQDPVRLRTAATGFFDRVQEKLLETAFSDNPTGAETPWLLDGDGVVDLSPVAGAGVSTQRAVEILTQGLADVGGGQPGMLHCTAGMAATVGMLGYASDRGGKLTMERGDVVVDGAGYSGFGPDVGAGPVDPGSPNLRWMYATGPVVVRLGDIHTEWVPGAPNPAAVIDRATNAATVTATRFAAAYFDPGVHFGVLVDLDLDA